MNRSLRASLVEESAKSKACQAVTAGIVETSAAITCTNVSLVRGIIATTIESSIRSVAPLAHEVRRREHEPALSLARARAPLVVALRCVIGLSYRTQTSTGAIDGMPLLPFGIHDIRGP